jgi:predicted enzyme related to lactoylglutathione lyase
MTIQTHRLASLAPLVLCLCLLAPASTSAQLLAAKDGPVVYGHHHVNASNVDEHKRFWTTIGGVVTAIGTNKVEVVKFPNALLFMRAQKPTGGSKGTTVDHIGFSVPDLRQVVDRVKAAGFRMITAADAPSNITVKDDIGIVEGGGPVSGIAYTLGPDEVKVELLEMKAQAAPIVSHHVHFFGANTEMHAWYMKTFGASTATSANPAFVTANLPGLVMNFTPAQAVVGTAGRALDHIGFEVEGLEAFTRKLESQGIKLVVPYRAVPALGIAIAFITDPWGTYIELTEGLDQIN